MLQSLSEADLHPHAIRQFDRWWEEAVNSNIDEVNAMTLATVDPEGKPSARIVLLKGYDEQGFVFFTNYESRKGKELSSNPHTSVVFFWKELERQIRICGVAEKISSEESDTYFHSRPEESRIGAWASAQSNPIASREALENRFNEIKEKYSGQKIERPPHWGGFRIKPYEIEFWQGRPGRLHDRICYSLIDNDWSHVRLCP